MVRRKRKVRILDRFDASPLVGLAVVTLKATEEIDEGLATGPEVFLPQIESLTASAAVARCLLAPRLTGQEVRRLRHLLDMTQAELAVALGGEIVVQTISRWESETKNVSAAMEKQLRWLVCEWFKHQAPGVAYDPVALIALKLTERERKMAPLEFRRARTTVGRSIEEHWTTTALATPAAKKAA
jgi:DNA-binding transcriptional regulator YiaG